MKSSHGCHARPHCPGSLEVTCGPDTKKGEPRSGVEMNSLGGTPRQWVFCMLPSLASLAGPGLGNDYPVELSVIMEMS